MGEILIETNNLKKYFPVQSKGIKEKKNEYVKAVDNVNLNIYKNETLALVGESGCGKSTLGRLIINLIKPTEGEVYYNEQNINELNKKDMRELRKKIQIIFQDPYASLNPRMKVIDIIGEPLVTHNVLKGKDKLEIVTNLMEVVGIRKEYMNRYPHMFSGGQRQRIGIARALALNPDFIVCDEPVSALDVSIQAQVLNLLKDLQHKLGLTYLYISHDLSTVRYIADRVCVMFLGKIVEIGDCKDVFNEPIHPYTMFLLNAVPIPDPNIREREKLILEGDIPSPVNPPSGCRFHTRCPYAKDICSKEEPKLIKVNGREYACHFPLT